MYPQPRSYLYLILSLVSGATSLYFFRDNALLFLSWYLLIIMAETHDKYGRKPCFQGLEAPQIRQKGTTFTIASSQWPYGSQTSRAPQLKLLLNLPAWPPTPTPSTIRSKPWQFSLPPPELYKLPLDEDLPVDILNINSWSLIQPSSRRDGISTAEFPAEDLRSLENPNNYDVRNGTGDGSCEPRTTQSEKENEALCRSQNISKEQRREKLHSRRSSHKTSIQDFTSEIKYSLELTKNAVLEAKERERTRTIECTSCFDDVLATDSIGLACSHAYCKSCFSKLVKTVMLNEQSWPPKCCLTEVPLKVVLSALDVKERIEYKTKAAEYTIPAGDRLYCPGSGCHRFIPPSRSTFADMGSKCPHCSVKICRMCRGEAHAGQRDCPQDFGLNAALESAHEEGWQRCFRCRTMVELTTGCRHITCKCRAEFCYVCGLQWRTCACTETDLVNRRAEGSRRRAQRVQRNAIRDAAALREDQEITRVIAEVAEFERRQVVMRTAARSEEERERREEEELFARLKAMSAEEERQRLQDENLADKQRQEVLHLSMIEHILSIHKHLEELVLFQQRALISRHDSDVAAFEENIKRDRANTLLQTRTILTMLTSNAEKRRNTIIDRHSREVETLRIEHNGREDAMFLQMQTYMQGKPNSLEHQKWIQDSFKRQLEEESKEQTVKHSFERTKFETQLQHETQGIELAHELDARIIEERKESRERAMNSKVKAERQYFDFALKRRERLLEVHATQLLAEVGGPRDPQGLNREMATFNLVPFPGTGKVDGQSEQTTSATNLVDPTTSLVSQPSGSADPGRSGQPKRLGVEMLPALAISQHSSEVTDDPQDQDNEANPLSRTTTLGPTRTMERHRSSVWNVFGWSKDWSM